MVSDAESARRYRERRYAEIDKMPKIPCACGCGTMIPPINKMFKPARYAHNHHPKSDKTQFKPGHSTWNKGYKNYHGAGQNKGRKQSKEEIEKHIVARRLKFNGAWTTKRGWKHTPDAIQHMRDAQEPRYGKDNPFYGKKHTEEAKLKMSKASKGRIFKHSPESRKRISAGQTGPKHHNWKGGVVRPTEWREFRTKVEWIEARKATFERDDYTCQYCGRRGCELNAHHIKSFNLFPDDRLSVDNLVSLCIPCHRWIHSKANVERIFIHNSTALMP